MPRRSLPRKEVNQDGQKQQLGQILNRLAIFKRHRLTLPMELAIDLGVT